MISTLETKIKLLDQDIQHILSSFPDDILSNTYKIKGLLILALDDLSSIFFSNKNISDEEEIYFFKKVKCPLHAKIIYFNNIAHVEIKKPTHGTKDVKSYFETELNKVNDKIRENLEFYQYFKSEKVDMDYQYFRRSYCHQIFGNNDLVHITDGSFSTAYEHIFIQIEYCDLMKSYLTNGILNLISETNFEVPALIWTDSKVKIIELIYAVYFSGVFNHGKAEIKEITEYFQKVFSVDLNNQSRTFYDIKARKCNKTKFMDELKVNLMERIKNTENDLFL